MKATEMKMRVDEITLREWKYRKNHKDISNISKLTGRTRNEVATALNFGFCSGELRKEIDNFYNQHLEY